MPRIANTFVLVEDAIPIVVLIPKRHVETWIQALLGNDVDEETDYTKSLHESPTASGVKNAAEALFDWTRPGANAPATAPFSLRTSISEWRKIDL